MTRYLDRIGDGHVFETVEMGSNETIKQAVIAGLGIAFLSLHTVTEELHAGRLVLLNAPNLPILRRWYLAWPAGQPLRPVTARLRDEILGLQGDFLPQ
jgi:DNA-binding transcriptional LysR family regulator